MNIQNLLKGRKKLEQAKLDRINELYHKSQKEPLTEEELLEQAKLRREYIDSYKRSLVGELDNTYIVDEKGNKRKLQKKD